MELLGKIWHLLRKKPALGLGFLILAGSLAGCWFVHQESQKTRDELTSLRKDYDHLAIDYNVIREFVMATFRRSSAPTYSMTATPEPAGVVPVPPTPPVPHRIDEARAKLRELPDRADFVRPSSER